MIRLKLHATQNIYELIIYAINNYWVAFSYIHYKFILYIFKFINNYLKRSLSGRYDYDHFNQFTYIDFVNNELSNYGHGYYRYPWWAPSSIQNILKFIFN